MPLCIVINHIMLIFMTQSKQLQIEIEAAAEAMGISPSTLGERCGQGGQFYARLVNGKRIWPETAQKVRDKIKLLKTDSDAAKCAACDTSHGAAESSSQGGVAE